MNQTVTYVVIVAIILILMGVRVYRMTRERRWSVTQMWFAPAILLVITAILVFFDARTSTLLAALLAPVGLAAGIAIGLYQGTHTTVRVDRANQSLFVKTSPIGTPASTKTPLPRMQRSPMLAPLRTWASCQMRAPSPIVTPSSISALSCT